MTVCLNYSSKSCRQEAEPKATNWQDFEGRTALHVAVADGQLKTVAVLLANRELLTAQRPNSTQLTGLAQLNSLGQLNSTHWVGSTQLTGPAQLNSLGQLNSTR